MEQQPLLFLAIANRNYGGDPEMIGLLRLMLQRAKLDARIEIVSEREIVATAKRRKPALILAGYRVISHDPSMSSFGDQALKILKSDPDTRGIPILLLEAYYDIERVAKECGIDAYLMVPFGPKEFLDAVTRLTGIPTRV
jgi:CheY-like chemotaxis protein